MTVSSMLTHSFWGKKSFSFHGEGGPAWGALSAICYQTGGICCVATFGPRLPLWHSLSLLTMGILFGACPVTGYRLAPTMMPRSCHACDPEGLIFCTSFSSNSVSSYSQDILVTRKPKRLQLPSLYHFGVCVSLSSHGSTHRGYFYHLTPCPCIARLNARLPWGSLYSFQDTPWKARPSWLSL